MTSRFNALYRGSIEDMVSELENEHRQVTVDELRLALINTLQKLQEWQGRVETYIQGANEDIGDLKNDIFHLNNPNP